MSYWPTSTAEDDIVIESPGERFVYLVRSAIRPALRYRVDLTACAGATECSCKDWATRRGPAIKAGMPLGTRATLCRHGILARRYFLNGVLAALAAKEENK